jgi:hypothetical protein
VPADRASVTAYVLEEQDDWCEEEIRMVRSLALRGQRAADLGAGHGIFALTLAQRVGATGKVWAFESEPTLAAHLRQGAAANAFGQVTVLESPLVDFAEALAACASSLDFLRVDVEGADRVLTALAPRLLTIGAPVVMLKTRRGRQTEMGPVRSLASLGYTLYRHLPGLDVLAPLAPGDESDPFLLYVFACKDDIACELEERQLLAGSVQEAPSPPPGCWRERSEALRYADRWRATWGEAMASDPLLRQALDHHAMAHRTDQPASQRYAHLHAALKALFGTLRRTPSLPALLTLARVSWEAGRRQIAVETLNLLVKRLFAPSGIPSAWPFPDDQPFLPVSPRFDHVTPREDDPQIWLLASVLEQRERLRALSSFYTADDPATLTCLQALEQSGYATPEMTRRMNLVRAKGPTG